MGWKTLLLAFVILVLATACSERPESAEITTPVVQSSEQTVSSDGTEKSADIVSSEPLEGGRFVRLFVDPPTLDPHLTTDATSAQIIVEVFGGLVTIDKELNVVPDLAESWDISQDGTVYTFRLRPDATFHDGKPVTSEDVRWSLERVTSPLTESPNVDQYLGDIVGVDKKLAGDALEISGVRVINERTIEMTIDQSKSFFLAKLTYPTAFVLDKLNVEGDPKNWFRKPNGTGPFKMTEYRVGETLVLSRHDGYHLGPAKLAQVEMILSGGTSMLMYENDEIDVAGVGLADIDRLNDPTHSLNEELVTAPPAFSIQYIGLNVAEPPLDDIKVRQALNLAIDKEEIATIVLGDQVVPAKGILPPGFPGFNESISGYEFDPVRAQQLLRDSSYGNDLDNLPTITITTPGSFGANVSLDMEVILAMWEKNLGISTEFQQTEFATFLKDLNKRRFQMFDIGWIADYPDPENFLDVLFYSDSSNNHTNYNNPQVNALLEKARVETDEDLRFSIYSEVEQMILDDAPWIPLWYSGERYLLVKPNVHDYLQTPLIIPKLKHVYLTEE